MMEDRVPQNVIESKFSQVQTMQLRQIFIIFYGQVAHPFELNSGLGDCMYTFCSFYKAIFYGHTLSGNNLAQEN